MASLCADRRNEKLAGEPIVRAYISDSSMGSATPGIASAVRFQKIRLFSLKISESWCDLGSNMATDLTVWA
jgi:hypothetical protein